VRELVVLVELGAVRSCGTDVQEVNIQLPTRIKSAEIRSFFIGYALGVEPLRAR